MLGTHELICLLKIQFAKNFYINLRFLRHKMSKITADFSLLSAINSLILSLMHVSSPSINRDGELNKIDKDSNI